MTTWILLLAWTALVAWLGYRYADHAMRLFERAFDRVAEIARRVLP